MAESRIQSESRDGVLLGQTSETINMHGARVSHRSDTTVFRELHSAHFCSTLRWARDQNKSWSSALLPASLAVILETESVTVDSSGSGASAPLPP
mmetsp:Transcript_88849/g.147034  ORF Transcript_88849/g.147034 Transcript_88849/m.147034 type:complete len:95 (-) Transcript_88849:1442-1726(-)